MRATRLPRLHVITDTRGPFAPVVGTAPRSGLAASGAPPARGGEIGTTLHVTKPDFVALLRDPLVVVAAALAAGARLIQVRPEDHYNDRTAFDLATAVAALCAEYGALCLVNDRVHIAQSVGADGVHLGAEDLPIDAARRILPAASIIGGTSRDPESARAARRAGATYLGVGPVWGTTTKTGLPQPIGLDGLAAVCEAVDLPVIAIGGITPERAALCREAGAHGVAVVGAIASAEDPNQATAELLEAVGESPAARNATSGSVSRRGGELAARRSADAYGDGSELGGTGARGDTADLGHRAASAGGPADGQSAVGRVDASVHGDDGTGGSVVLGDRTELGHRGAGSGRLVVSGQSVVGRIDDLAVRGTGTDHDARPHDRDGALPDGGPGTSPDIGILRGVGDA